MQVYAIKAMGHYGGGMAIVAATSEPEAMLLAGEIQDFWETRYHKPESIKELPVKYRGKPKVLVHFETGK